MLHSFGRVDERRLELELAAARRSAEPRDVAGFLEGLLLTRRAVLGSSPRLLRAVDRVLLDLPDELFVRLLPDLRRAFAALVPSEIEALGQRVVALDLPIAGSVVPAGGAALGRALEERVRQLSGPIAAGILGPSSR